jgi:hypothetical protein
MSWASEALVSNDPTGYISDKLKTLCGVSPCRNWSFVENLAAGVGTAEIMTLTLTNWSAGGTFTITFNGHTTAAVSYASDISATLLAALNGLAEFTGANSNVTVARTSATVYTITSQNTTKWYGVSFSAVGTFTLTGGGSPSPTGAFVVTTPAVTRTNVSNFDIDVFKCAGSGNDANDAAQDFYVIITRDKTGAGTGFTITLAQIWSTVYHKPANVISAKAGATSSGFEACDASGWPATSYTAGQFINPAYVAGSNSQISFWACTLNKSGFVYQIKLTKNLVVFSFRVASTDYCFYAGLFDSLVVGTDTYPMCVVSSQTSTGPAANGAFLNVTALPGAIGTGVSGTFGINCGQAAQMWTNGWTIANINNGTNSFDKLANNGLWVSRCCLNHNVSYTVYYLWGCVRGLLKSDLLIMPPGGTVNIGDTVYINAVQWTVMGKLGAYAVALCQPS